MLCVYNVYQEKDLKFHISEQSKYMMNVMTRAIEQKNCSQLPLRLKVNAFAFLLFRRSVFSLTWWVSNASVFSENQ